MLEVAAVVLAAVAVHRLVAVAGRTLGLIANRTWLEKGLELVDQVGEGRFCSIDWVHRMVDW